MADLRALVLRALVLRACANAEENGYPLDDDNEQEAIDILGNDADVAALVPDWDALDEPVAEVARYVAEYKAGARADG